MATMTDRIFLFLVLVLLGTVCKLKAQSCGVGYTYPSDYGVLQSPNYPNAYSAYCPCTYYILRSAIRSILLTFETFELDRYSLIGDNVTVRCLANVSFIPVTYYWNSVASPISIPYCSYAQIHFQSDAYNFYSVKGFRIQYQVNTGGCGNTVYTEPSGIITSPNYPNSYSNNENCAYLIWSSQPSSIALNFHSFSLQWGNSTCPYDWVQIRCDSNSYTLPKYCGSTIPKPIVIEDCNQAQIWFHTSGSYVYRRFSLQFSVTPNGCGQSNYTGSSGVIMSPNYPKSFRNITCHYYLHPISSVTLTFLSFDLEPFVDNTFGHNVQISCLKTDGSMQTSTYRGSTLPLPITFTSCSLVRVFLNATNNVLSGTGFKIQYQVNALAANGAIIDKPLNVAVYFGKQTQLNCTSDVIGYFPSWTLSRDGTDENTTVIASFCVVNSQYTSKYSVVKGGQGVCNLVISNATLVQAGVYTCIDVSLAAFSSIVSVIDVVYTVRKQPEIVKGDILTFQYSVKFNDSVAPAPILPMIYYWNLTGKSVAFSNITLPNTLISYINVTAEPEQVPSFGFVVTFSAPAIRNGYATNAPAYIYSRFSTTYVVLYWPEASNMTISGDNNGYMDYNGSLECSVSSNPPSIYRWLDSSSGIYTDGSTVSVTKGGTYTCNASNVIRGKTYWSSKSVTIYNSSDDSSDEMVTIVVLAVLLAISVLGYIGFAIFRIARRSKPKPSDEDQRNRTESIPSTILYANDYTTTPTVRPTYENLPNQILSSESLMTTGNNNQGQYEYLNRAFQHPVVYESLS